MKLMANNENRPARHRLVLLFAGLLVLTAIGIAYPSLAQQDGRSRRATGAPPTPTPPRMATPTPAPTPKGSATPDDGNGEVDPEDIIKVDTDLVNVNVRVVDRNNRPISDVKEGEFSLFEDGVQQQIGFFSKEEVPISYGIAVDNSGSLRSQLLTVIDASKTLIGNNRPGDETFIVRFTGQDNIQLLQDFTSNKKDLIDTMEEQMLVEPGQTAIIDAVYLSVERLGQYRKSDDPNDRRRRALILVTDGEDRDSYHNEKDLFNLLRETDVQIYVIGFVEELSKEGGFVKKSPQEKAVRLLDDLSKQTGGRVFYPKSLDELPGIAGDITRDLRTQYVLGYYPSSKTGDGNYHSLKVTVADAPGKDKRLALTRSGRTANTTTKPVGPANTPKPATPTPTPRRP